MIAFTEDNKCIFLDQQKQCTIYEDRPLACRQFGKFEEVMCPYIHLNGEPRTVQEIEAIRGEMHTNVMDQFERMHTLLSSKQAQEKAVSSE